VHIEEVLIGVIQKTMKKIQNKTKVKFYQNGNVCAQYMLLY